MQLTLGFDATLRNSIPCTARKANKHQRGQKQVLPGCSVSRFTFTPFLTVSNYRTVKLRLYSDSFLEIPILRPISY